MKVKCQKFAKTTSVCTIFYVELFRDKTIIDLSKIIIEFPDVPIIFIYHLCSYLLVFDWAKASTNSSPPCTESRRGRTRPPLKQLDWQADSTACFSSGETESTKSLVKVAIFDNHHMF